MGFLLRLMMVWKACTIWQATGTGSSPLCGMAAWPPLPRMRDFEFVAGRHDRPGADGKLAHLGARPVVHAKHGLHGELETSRL